MAWHNSILQFVNEFIALLRVSFEKFQSNTKFRLALFLIVLVIYSGALYVLYYNLWEEIVLLRKSVKWGQSSGTAQVVKAGQSMFCALLSILCIILSGLNYKSTSELYTCIKSVSKKVSVKSNETKKTFLIIMYLIILPVIFIFESIYSKMDNILYWHLVYCLFDFLYISLTLEVSLISCRLEELFNALNEELGRIMIFCDIPHMAAEEGATICSGGTALRNLSDNHLVLSEAIGAFNSSFGPRLALVFANFFSSFIVSPYFMIHALGSSDNGSVTSYDFIRSLTSCLISYLQFCTIVVFCGQAVSSGMKAGNVVAKHLKPSLSQEMRAEVKVFLLLVSETDRLEFSAAGLFHINESLITSVTGAVGTYLVILLQFPQQE